MKTKRFLAYMVLLTVLPFTVAYSSWNDIEQAVGNAVVKVFVAEKKINWFYPYNVSSGGCTGTGFFIDDKGLILTCAHVIENAVSVSIGIPSLGKHRFKAHVVGMHRQKDVALVRLDEDALHDLQKAGTITTHLTIGNSDLLRRGEEVLLLGYPGTMQSDVLKSTVGVVSFNNGVCIQYDASANPGNSGGPLLNTNYEVVGICDSRDIAGGKQGINFAVPMNIAMLSLPYLHDNKVFEIADFGIVVSNAANKAIKEYLNCPVDGGCFVCEVDQKKQAYATGLRANDIIYEIDGYTIDSFGEIISPFNGERVHAFDYMEQLSLDIPINIAVYRNGESHHFVLVREIKKLNNQISRAYPAYETVDFEVFAGLIITPLTVNYINSCKEERPGLQRYLTRLYNQGSRLVVANVLTGSEVSQINAMRWADTINEVNGEPVATLDDFRKVLLKSVDTGFVVIKTTDELTLNTDNIITVLSLQESCKETIALSKVHGYPLSETVQQLINKVC